MKSEWTMLDINKCSIWPDDLIFGNYEWEWDNGMNRSWHPCKLKFKQILDNPDRCFRYRKRHDSIHQAREMASCFVNTLPKGEFKIVNDKNETVEYLYTIDDIKKAFIAGYIANEPS